jgi:hypothetical protein
LCALVIVNSAVFPAVVDIDPYVPLEMDQETVVGSYFLSVTEHAQDPVMEYYRDPDYQAWVIDFFATMCSSREVAVAILRNVDEFDVPAALAFALCWEESKFFPRAINRYNRDGSTDRGLFQLNNRSFPDLDTTAFFDVFVNARYGVSHLRHCLDAGGTEVSALAMYNAGAGRVTTTGAPKVTLNYISRILENRSKIESRFHTMLIREQEERMRRIEHRERERERDRSSVQLHF